jgi:hypothetical protein
MEAAVDRVRSAFGPREEAAWRSYEEVLAAEGPGYRIAGERWRRVAKGRQSSRDPAEAAGRGSNEKTNG